jgi:hypothetical protein
MSPLALTLYALDVFAPIALSVKVGKTMASTVSRSQVTTGLQMISRVHMALVEELNLEKRKLEE